MSTAQAQKRLQLAFERLEAAAQGMKDQDRIEAGAQAELLKLRAELDQSRRDYAALEARTAGASTRIDAAVVRLKAVLDA